MKIATFNTNSVRARLPVITGWLGREKPDLLCLQETKVQDEMFPAGDFEDSGYHVVFSGRKSYNGVAVAAREALEVLRRDLFKEDEGQARFLEVIYSGLRVINVYVPQGFEVGSDKFAYKLRWLEALHSYITGRFDPAFPLVVLGDLNVALTARDVYDPEHFAGKVAFHPDEQAILRSLLDWGLVDLFRKHEPGPGHYTFWDYRMPNGVKRNLGWRIDYILATPPVAERSIAAWIDRDARLLPKPSDHTFLTVEVDFHS
ncbi:MAG TPA: exodeoxyribonuclease III [Desulfobacteraceae bacterium]|nr:exodeoxyribonuclease III [Desulfobacteraceae bacterium]